MTLSAVWLMLFIAACVAWLRGGALQRFEGLTYNSNQLADGGQLHFSVATKPLGVVFSHHRLKEAALRRGWLPFSVRAAPVSRKGIQDWYLSHDGRGFAGIWFLPGVDRDDHIGTMYEIFIPHWVLAVLTGGLTVL